jgi:hypothetical protein
VGTAAIANAAITNAKIGNLAVDTAQIANAAIDSAKIENLAVGTAAVQDAAIVNAKINNLAVTDAKIQDVTAAKIKTGTVLATETITSEGVIRAVDDINTPTVQTGIGPIPLTVNGSAVTSLMWSFNAAGVTFSIDELGNPFFKGTIAASGFTNDELTIDSDGNVESTGTFRFGGAADNFINFDGTDLIVDTPFLEFDADSATFGNKATEEYIEFDGTVLTLGDNVTIGDNSDRAVTVGSGGDYSTINLALEALSRTVPAYKNGGFTATITTLAGYVESENIDISQVDLVWITLKSYNGVLEVSTSTLSDLDFWMRVREGGAGPTIDVDINVTGTETVSDLIVITGAGRLRYAKQFGAPEINISGQLQFSAILCEQSSSFYAPSLEINSTTGNYIVAAADQSTVSIDLLYITAADSSGIIATDGGRCTSSVVTMSVKSRGLYAVDGSYISANSSTITVSSPAPQDIVCLGGSIISVSGTTGTTNISRNTPSSAGLILG